MKAITYTIPLDPMAWKRAGVNFDKRLFFDQQKNEKIALGLYLLREHGNAPKWSGPIAVDVICYIKIPKSIKDRNLNGSPWCDVKPDDDNYAKLIRDAINDTQTIWGDDCQVADGRTRKVYDKNPRTVITIYSLINIPFIPNRCNQLECCVK